jgi:hypothetical protein
MTEKTSEPYSTRHGGLDSHTHTVVRRTDEDGYTRWFDICSFNGDEWDVTYHSKSKKFEKMRDFLESESKKAEDFMEWLNRPISERR